jgi:hypothetical protein
MATAVGLLAMREPQCRHGGDRDEAVRWSRVPGSTDGSEDMETEHPQPPQVSVSGRIVIEGQLPASSVAEAEIAPKPPSPWWKLWSWPNERVAAWATVVLAVATIILAIMTKCSIEEARSEFETTQRPWLNSNETFADSPLSFNKQGANVQLKVQIPNSGNTPAVSLFINGVIIVDEPEQSFAPATRADTLRRRCTALRPSRKTNPQTQMSIFPKSHIEGHWGAYESRQEIEKAKKRATRGNPRHTALNILYRLPVYLR